MLVLEKKRKLWLASILSFFMSGLGQIYNGQFKKGLTIFLGEIVIVLLLFNLIVGTFTGLIIMLSLIFFYRILFMFDAALSAKKQKHFTLKNYNSFYFYIFLFLLMCFIIYLSINISMAFLNFRTLPMLTTSMEKTIMCNDYLLCERFLESSHIKNGDIIVFEFPGKRDDVYPKNTEYRISRCVGIAGDTLQIINNKLFINGNEVQLNETIYYNNSLQQRPSETLETFPVGRGYTHNNYGPIRIPKKGDTLYLTDNFSEWDTFIKREKHNVIFNGINLLIDNNRQSYYIVEKNYCFVLGDNRDNSYDSRYWGFIPYENILYSPKYIYWSKELNSNSIRMNRIGKLIE